MHFLSARPLSTGRSLPQPSPPTVRLLWEARHQDHPWTLLLPLERRSIPLQPSAHPQSPPAQAHPSTPSTAVRIPSVHPHRSPPGLPVSLPIFPGTFYYYVVLKVVSVTLLPWFCNHLSLTSRLSFESSRHGLCLPPLFIPIISICVILFSVSVFSLSLCSSHSLVWLCWALWFLHCLFVSTSHSLFWFFSPHYSRRPPGAPSHRPTIIRPAEPSLLD